MTIILRFSILRCPLRSHASQSPRRSCIDGHAITGYENRISCGTRAQRYLIIFRACVKKSHGRVRGGTDPVRDRQRAIRYTREMRHALERGMINEMIALVASLEESIGAACYRSTLISADSRVPGCILCWSIARTRRNRGKHVMISDRSA